LCQDSENGGACVEMTMVDATGDGGCHRGFGVALAAWSPLWSYGGRYPCVLHIFVLGN